jgi:hypothetical protein
MIIKGSAKITGLGFRGQKTLLSIGNAIHLFDYRKGIADLSAARVPSWGDLGPNGHVLIQPNTSRRPMRLADGIGDDGTLADNASLYSTPTAALNKLHDGSAVMQFAVMKIDEVDAVNILLGITSPGAGVMAPGQLFQYLGATQRISFRVYNDAAGILSTQAMTAMVPSGKDVLIMRLYYGSGTGSNNHKLYCENVVESFTLNPAFGSAQCSRFTFGKSSTTTMDAAVKMMGAYDLSGKTISQINDFVPIFCDTLKSDNEFATLITP